jgi:tetratricopeptide (TPR) repeat protein
MRNYESAIETLEKAVEIGYQTEEVLYEIGLSYAYLDQCDKGREWLLRALGVNPNSQPALQGLRICPEK